MIDIFDGEYAFLSNFYECDVTYNGLTYKNSEAAFHAQKTLNEDERKQFTTLNPPASKKLGRKINLRSDWELVKNKIMYEICYAKFSQNEELKEKLLATGDKYLEEGTYWHDNCWGNCYCEKCQNIIGENRLGKILMRVREELKATYFDANKVKDDIVKWIQDWFEQNGKGCAAIVGISGGTDSSVVAALCVEALGRNRVIGVLMPNGIQKDINAATQLVDHLGIKFLCVNIKKAVKAILDNIFDILPERDGYEDISISEQTRINLPPRIRMSTLYAVSQSLNGRVANTCNLSEDWIGYSTRWGDSVGDFSPLSNLTKTEVKQIGHVLGLPQDLVEKVPSDGLCGKTDEDNFGFTYDVLDKYIRTGKIDDFEIKEKIDNMHQKNLFKLQPIQSFQL